jgi:amino acid transporter
MFCSEALGLLVLSLVVLVLAHGHLGAPFHASGGSPGGFKGLVGFTFALAVSGFVGWENSGALAEESRNPRRYIPITVFTSILVITILYVLSSWAAVAGFADWKGPVAGINVLGGEVTPFLDLSRHFTPWSPGSSASSASPARSAASSRRPTRRPGSPSTGRGPACCPGYSPC